MRAHVTRGQPKKGSRAFGADGKLGETAGSDHPRLCYNDRLPPSSVELKESRNREWTDAALSGRSYDLSFACKHFSRKQIRNHKNNDGTIRKYRPNVIIPCKNGQEEFTKQIYLERRSL